MNFIELVMLSLGLSTDAFVVAISAGLTMDRFKAKKALIIGLYFGMFQAGMPVIGYLLAVHKDIFGTMLNTLILAYIGSALSIMLLITAYTASMIELFNSEMIIVEFLRALVGSFGMLLTVPLTAAICAWLYTKDNYNEV